MRAYTYARVQGSPSIVAWGGLIDRSRALSSLLGCLGRSPFHPCLSCCGQWSLPSFLACLSRCRVTVCGLWITNRQIYVFFIRENFCGIHICGYREEEENENVSNLELIYSGYVERPASPKTTLLEKPELVSNMCFSRVYICIKQTTWTEPAPGILVNNF
jgi:hypothetical protein